MFVIPKLKKRLTIILQLFRTPFRVSYNFDRMTSVVFIAKFIAAKHSDYRFKNPLDRVIT